MKNGPWSASLDIPIQVTASSSIPSYLIPPPVYERFPSRHGFQDDTSPPPDLSYFPGPPPDTHTSQLLLPHHRGGRKKRRPSGYQQSNSKNRGKISLRWQEKGSRRSVLEHPTPSSFCASWELAMYLSRRLPSVHLDSLHPPASGYVSGCLALCAVLWAQAGASPCAAGHARLQEQEAL